MTILANLEAFLGIILSTSQDFVGYSNNYIVLVCQTKMAVIVFYVNSEVSPYKVCYGYFALKNKQ